MTVLPVSDAPRRSIIIGAYALLAILIVPVYAHFPSPNEFTRWALASALIERHSVEVSPEAAMLGPAFEDLAVAGGRTFSNKSPGLALLTLPGYLMARLAFGPAAPSTIRWFIYAMRLVGSTLPLILLAFWFFRCGSYFAVDRRRVSTVVFALLFATPLFTYGLLLFSHALVGACLFGAWSLAFMNAERRAGLEDLYAGGLMGLAVLSEYTAAAAVMVLVLGALLSRRWGRVLRIVAGGIPFAVILGIYQKFAFGSYFSLSSGFEKFPQFRAVAHTGFFGIGLPSPGRMVHLLVDPSKGLLLFSPFLILVPLAWQATRRRLDLPAFATLVAVPLITFLSISGYANWHGGWTVGPRYLVQAIPFTLFFLLFLDRRPLEDLLIGFSTTAVFLTSVVFPFVPDDFIVPWGTLSLELLRRGAVASNVLAAHSPALTISISGLIVLLAAGLVYGSRELVAFGGGVALALLAGVVALQAFSSPRAQVERAYFADVYFCRSGALESAFRSGVPVSLSLEHRRAYELKIPPADCR